MESKEGKKPNAVEGKKGGEKFTPKVDKFKLWEELQPLHPNCRCIISKYH